MSNKLITDKRLPEIASMSLRLYSAKTLSRKVYKGIFLYNGVMPEDNKKTNIAFAFSLTSGLLILLNSIIFLLMLLFAVPTYQEETYGWHMMGRMMSFWFGSWAWLFLTIGMISGIVILISSLMLRSKQGENLIWGTLIITFSVLSIFSMGGFFFGLIFGIIGGVLAIVET